MAGQIFIKFDTEKLYKELFSHSSFHLNKIIFRTTLGDDLQAFLYMDVISLMLITVKNGLNKICEHI
jgi:hypothetical protein